VLFGLNIRRSAGSSRGASRCTSRTVEALAAATLEQLEEVEGIGPERAELIAEWFADFRTTSPLVAELRELGLQLALAEGRSSARGGAAHSAAVRRHRNARGLDA
jgi:DNA ligase (NAD+)